MFHKHMSSLELTMNIFVSDIIHLWMIKKQKGVIVTNIDLVHGTCYAFGNVMPLAILRFDTCLFVYYTMQVMPWPLLGTC